MFPDYWENPVRVMAVNEHINRGGMPITFCHSEACSGVRIDVSNEWHKFDSELNGIDHPNDILLYGYSDIIGHTVDWESTDSAITNIVITDAFDVTATYIPDVDYKYVGAGTIRRLPGGTLRDQTYVAASYSWSDKCIDDKTKAPKRYCPTCFGVGYITAWTQDTRAIFSMPSFKLSWMAEGQWKQGDAVFGFGPDLNINAEPRDVNGIIVRDKIIIRKFGKFQTWVVMGANQAASMQGDYLSLMVQTRQLDTAASYGVK